MNLQVNLVMVYLLILSRGQLLTCIFFHQKPRPALLFFHQELPFLQLSHRLLQFSIQGYKPAKLVKIEENSIFKVVFSILLSVITYQQISILSLQVPRLQRSLNLQFSKHVRTNVNLKLGV